MRTSNGSAMLLSAATYTRSQDEGLVAHETELKLELDTASMAQIPSRIPARSGIALSFTAGLIF